MIKVLIVEDNNAVRRGLVGLLNKQNQIAIVGETENGLKAIELLKQGLEADIVLADLNMPIMDGITLTEKLQVLFPLIKVVILTMHTRVEFVDRALKAGVRGYLLKDGDFNEIYEGIHKVYNGEVHISVNLE
jgi:DNA-binding NarL/FixJ family response regulator